MSYFAEKLENYKNIMKTLKKLFDLIYLFTYKTNSIHNFSNKNK